MLPSHYSRHPYPLIFTNVIDLINTYDSNAAWKEDVTTVKKYSKPGADAHSNNASSFS